MYKNNNEEDGGTSILGNPMHIAMVENENEAQKEEIRAKDEEIQKKDEEIKKKDEEIQKKDEEINRLRETHGGSLPSDTIPL